MPKAFSLASWNVEHFKKKDTRVDRVIALLKKQNPDVFALYEVEGKEVFAELSTQMPAYSFHITEGPQIQEILVGVRSGLTAFFTQKIEFRSGVSSLRPGALLTLTIAGKNYTMLFLHTKSGNDPRGLGLRDDMLVKACEFRDVLKKASGGSEPNYLFMEDLNTMGMKYRYISTGSISSDEEMKKLTEEAKRKKMRLLTKTKLNTWSNGSNSTTLDSNLDHVIAAEHLKFKKFKNADVDVRGWAQTTTAKEKDEWIKQYSDHSLLYFEVQKI
jgi:hypothetical protein